LGVLYRPLAAQLLWHHKGGRSELEYGLGSINAKLQLLASFGPDASPENRGKISVMGMFMITPNTFCAILVNKSFRKLYLRFFLE